MNQVLLLLTAPHYTAGSYIVGYSWPADSLNGMSIFVFPWTHDKHFDVVRLAIHWLLYKYSRRATQ